MTGPAPSLRRLLLSALPVFLLLVGLGTWQMHRLAWKTDLIARIDSRMQAPPAPMPTDPIDPAEWAWRRVAAEGRFLDAGPLRVLARTYRGRLGLHLVHPFELADGRILLVNRGWIPAERQADPPPPPEGPHRVEGILREPSPPGAWFQPENRPAANEWFRIDPAAMAEALGVGNVLPVVLDSAQDGEGGLPVGGQTHVRLSNRHLEYALTWYALAAVLVVIVVAVARRR